MYLVFMYSVSSELANWSLYILLRAVPGVIQQAAKSGTSPIKNVFARDTDSLRICLIVCISLYLDIYL